MFQSVYRMFEVQCNIQMVRSGYIEEFPFHVWICQKGLLKISKCSQEMLTTPPEVVETGVPLCEHLEIFNRS